MMECSHKENGRLCQGVSDTFNSNVNSVQSKCIFELDLGYLNQKPLSQLVKESKSPVSQGLRTLKCSFAL